MRTKEIRSGPEAYAPGPDRFFCVTLLYPHQRSPAVMAEVSWEEAGRRTGRIAEPLSARSKTSGFAVSKFLGSSE